MPQLLISKLFSKLIGKPITNLAKKAITLISIPLCLFVLASCNPVEELEENCAAGDADACEILDTIDAAVAELEEAIPEGVTVASVFEQIEDAVSDTDTSDYTDNAKTDRIEDTLEPANIKERGLRGCLRALPPKPPVRNPICYGPRMTYANHPDSANNDANGQLPQGDLGLWLDTEPTANGAGRAPCAAVKMRELVAKSLHNIDMATGSVAMMMCAAAHEKISAPKNDGDTLNFADVLNEVPDSPFTITTATLTRIDANTLKTVFVAEHNAGTNNRLGALSITTTHNRSTQTGLVQIERTITENSVEKVVATSARYQPKAGETSTKQIQVLRGRFDPSQITDYYDSNGEVKLGPISQASGANIRNIENTRLFLAEFNRTDGTQNIAFGWNAGGNDSHFRVFNADANATTADAWYGYVPNPYANNSASTTTGEKPNLDLGADNAGMICNWAGPGNSHTVNNYLQHQSMVKNSNDRWVLATSGSLIRYVPTNDCELTTNSNTTFTAALNQGQVANATAFAAHDISAGETFDQSASNTEGLDLKANHDITIPASW